MNASTPLLFALSLLLAGSTLRCESRVTEAPAPRAEAPNVTARAEATTAAPAADEPLDPRVVNAAGLAKEIMMEPDRIPQILSARDMDRDQLDALMFEIALDQELSQEYQLARAELGL